MLACLLCPVPGTPSDRQALDAAATVALAFDCHVRALHARPDPLAFLPYLGEGMSPGAIDGLIADARRRGEEREAIARRIFDGWASERGIVHAQAPGVAGASCSWLREDGAEDAWIVRHGRLADMTILPLPGGEPGPAASIAAEAALIETGRPVLLAPAAPFALGGTVVVAWNASAQAARAVASALPILARARGRGGERRGGRPARRPAGPCGMAALAPCTGDRASGGARRGERGERARRSLHAGWRVAAGDGRLHA